MNENTSRIEQGLGQAGERAALSASEHALGRERLATLLAAAPLPRRSLYARLFASALKPAFALLLILTVGAGVASASESSLPGTLLYPVKTRVVEPTLAVLASSPEDRADFATERANRRLEEFAKITAAGETDSETSAALAVSLSEHVESATEAIAELALAGDAPGALDASADLHSILEAHVSIIDRVDDSVANIISGDEANVSDTLDIALTQTEALTLSLGEAVDRTDSDELTAALEYQEDSLDELIASLRAHIDEERSTFDASDEMATKEALGAAELLIDTADVAKSKGELAEAFSLLSEANEKLNGLALIIEADDELGIDVIGAPPSDDVADYELVDWREE